MVTRDDIIICSMYGSTRMATSTENNVSRAESVQCRPGRRSSVRQPINWGRTDTGLLDSLLDRHGSVRQLTTWGVRRTDGNCQKDIHGSVRLGYLVSIFF